MDFSYWNVIVTESAEQDIDNIIRYLITEKKSKQAAESFLLDFENTIDRLENVAGRLEIMDISGYYERKFRKIRMQKHRYYLIYRIVDDTARVLRVVHDLQDIDKILKSV